MWKKFTLDNLLTVSLNVTKILFVASVATIFIRPSVEIIVKNIRN